MSGLYFWSVIVLCAMNGCKASKNRNEVTVLPGNIDSITSEGGVLMTKTQKQIYPGRKDRKQKQIIVKRFKIREESSFLPKWTLLQR
eukprot:6109671-Amphidinium_carterae.1